MRVEGEEELARPVSSLWWSGLAAGMAISMSVVTEAVFHRYLPDTPWRPLVENFGYSVGFLLVILGRLQLFTENTITAVLPLAAERTGRNLMLTARLWGVVFAANLAGTLIFALATTHGGIFPAEQLQPMQDISHHFMSKPPSDMLLHGIPAGFLIALMVWMMPSSEGSEFWVIIVVTYLIAVCDLTHVVAGSAEAFLLLVAGEIGPWKTFAEFMMPAFIGNVIGGTGLFAVLAYVQVKEEI